MNTAEAAIVAEVMRRVRLMLGTAFDPAKSIGVIVPYRNQIAVIRREAERFGMPELEAVSIDTVERYQAASATSSFTRSPCRANGSLSSLQAAASTTADTQ